MDQINQIRDFNANTDAALGAVTVMSDPSFYRRRNDVRDAFLLARRQQRRQVRARKTNFIMSV